MVRNSRSPSSKGTQKRENVKKQVSRLLGQGDLEGLDELLSELDTIRDVEAALESLRDNGLLAYGGFVHSILDRSPRSKSNPFITFHLAHELFLQSMIANYTQAERIRERFPVHHYIASMKEAAEDLASGEASFSKSEKVARSLFANCYENYKKFCMQFAELAANARGDKISAAKNWRKYLMDTEPKYNRLLVDDVDTFIRNAISHRHFRLLKNGRFELMDKQGHVKTYSAKFLDRRLGLLWTRLLFVDTASSLTGLFSNQMLLIALRQRRRRK